MTDEENGAEGAPEASTDMASDMNIYTDEQLLEVGWSQDQIDALRSEDTDEETSNDTESDASYEDDEAKETEEIDHDEDESVESDAGKGDSTHLPDTTESIVVEDEPSSSPSQSNEVVGENKEVTQGMLLGSHRDDGSDIRIDPSVLARHAAMLGSTGSGKTVMAKALIEEATIAGIPSLILDPQGDIARLCLRADLGELAEKEGDAKRAQAFADSAEVRIWTPLRSKGIPMCIDPFELPPEGLDTEESITAWDMIAAGFTTLADYDLEKADGKQVKSALYEIITHAHRLGLNVGDFQSLAKAIRDPHYAFIEQLMPVFDEENEAPTWDDISADYNLPDFESMLPKARREEASRRISAYSSGVNQLLFSNGVAIDIDAICEPAEDGKVPINVVYLNTIQSDAQKQYFVQEIARALYDWMLRQQASDGVLNLLFFMDEVAPYLPPHPRNPPAKDLVKLIFKQARKYGVACVLATQNVSDVDYKILAQANTLCVGRFNQPQDIDRVRDLLKVGGSDLSLVEDLPTLSAGQFQLIAPDVSPDPLPLQCRWLYTDHGAPLSEDDVEQHTTDVVRAWAEEKAASPKTKRAASTPEPTAPKSIVAAGGAMAAAAAGVDTQDDAFEVRLMGGLSVLKDGSDPLYIMQGATNLASAIVLAWTMIALLLEWQSGALDWWILLLGVVITGGVLLIIALEAFLGHDAKMQEKIGKFARQIQYGLAIWLAILFWWSSRSQGLNLHGADLLLEVALVWVWLFIVIELVNRFRLGRLVIQKDITLLGRLKAGVSGLTSMISESEFKQMQTSSRQVLAGMRWCLDFVTLLFFALIIALTTLAGDVTLDQALRGLGGESFIRRSALWIGSIYLLSFIAETRLRLKTQ